MESLLSIVYIYTLYCSVFQILLVLLVLQVYSVLLCFPSIAILLAILVMSISTHPVFHITLALQCITQVVTKTSDILWNYSFYS